MCDLLDVTAIDIHRSAFAVGNFSTLLKGLLEYPVASLYLLDAIAVF